MLKNIHPLLSPDLLHALRAMGHGDEVVIADANFPAENLARRCIRLDGCSATEVLDAVLSVLPIDDFVSDAACTMKVVDSDETPDIVRNFQNSINELNDKPVPVTPLDRFDFYTRASKAFAIIQTGERRLYGNLILKKGVIR